MHLLGFLRERIRFSHKLNAALIALLAVRFALGVVYSVVIPLWEAPDEWGHYAFVHYIAEEKRLPPPGHALEVEFDESQQPPLYYVLAAAATAWIDTSDWTAPAVNPYARTGTGVGGLNMAVHTPEEAFPYKGWALAAHLARLVSVAISVVTVWLTYLLARQVSEESEWFALTAAAIVAFWPQFLFVGSVITNDILVVCCAVWVLLALVKTMRTWPPRYPHLLELGLAIGASMLSKYTALGLIALFPIAIVALGIRAFRRKEFSPRFWAFTGMTVAATAGLGGWWYLRNFAASGSPLLRYQQVLKSLTLLWQDPIYLGARLRPVDLPEAVRYGFLTFTASFGWGNVGASWWLHALFALLVVGGGLGFLIWLLRRARTPRVRHLGWLALAALCILAPPIYLLFYKGTALLRGRTILAVLPPLSIFIVLGIGHWLSKQWQRRLPIVVGSALAAIALAVPFLYIAPAYARPPLMQPEQLTTLSNPVYVRFGEEMELLGYAYGSGGRYAPGDILEVVVYWRALAKMDKNYTLRWQVLDAQEQPYGMVELYPGWGNYATSLWEPGLIVRDTYRFQIDAEMPSPGMGTAAITVLDAETDTVLAATDPQGQFLGLQLKLQPFKLTAGMETAPTDGGAEFVFGEQIALVARQVQKDDAARTITLYLTWQALRHIPTDYVVFVHVSDPAGTTVAQHDRQPRGGRYPTSLWDMGELVEDEIAITVPGGLPLSRYRLHMGVYDPDTEQRLLTYDTFGRRVLDDIIILPMP